MKTKIIVQCNKCQHQYKIHDKRVGEKFACFCGNLLEVPSVKIHDAAVVRCCSCGGTRGKEQEPFCRYCGSSFTLHARDLNTICPNCMTRISSKAKFCHSCATPIVIDTERFEKSNLACPNCEEQKLHSRKMPEEMFNLKECDCCAGIWITASVFKHLERQAQKEAASGTFTHAKKVVPNSHTRKEVTCPTKFYKKCPQCEVVMQRKNYAASSGVVVDVCHKHGMWFDIHELNEILAFIRSGLLLKHQEKAVRFAKRKKTSATAKSYNNNTRYDTSSRGDVLSDIVGWLLD